MKPVIKWLGGKTRLLPEIKTLLPKGFNRLIEPMAGGAALFFDLAAEDAVIGDSNPYLINFYACLAEHPSMLVDVLDGFVRGHCEEFFYSTRDALNAVAPPVGPNVNVAAQFYYLNRACFNGLWRVNRHDKINTPWGKHATFSVDRAALTAASKYLAGAQDIVCCDYATSIADYADEGDFIYLDPPYAPVDGSGFAAYTKDRIDHAQLADTAGRCVDGGLFVMVSNSDTPTVRALYADPKWSLHGVECSRPINANGAGRGKVAELIITGGYRP